MSTIVDKVLYTMPGWAARVNNNAIEVSPAKQIKKKLDELRSTKPYIVIVKFGHKNNNNEPIVKEVIGKCEQKYLRLRNQLNIITIPCSDCQQPIDLCTKILKILNNTQQPNSKQPNRKYQLPVGVISEQLIRILERTPEEIRVQYAWKPEVWRPDPDLEI